MYFSLENNSEDRASEHSLIKSYYDNPQQSDEKKFSDGLDEPGSNRDSWNEYASQLSSKRGFLFLSVLTFLNIILLVTSAILFLVARSHDFNQRPHPIRTAIGNLVNEYHPQRFELQHKITPYRGPPSPSVDKAWAELTEDTLMIVPDSDLHGQNFSSREQFRSSNKNYEGTLAKFEGFHALHCVYLLWKHTWPDYYTEEQAKMQRDPENTHIHIDHCADLLRQTIQCNMDFSILTFSETNNKIYSDFNILHQCQNFDSSLRYMKEHRWNIEEYT